MATKRATIGSKDDKGSQDANISKMCRLCLKPATNENLVDIFDPSTETSLTIRIMACAGLEVSTQDALPKKICLDCRLQLEKSFLFRNKSKNSDAKLRRHFRLINAGKVSHVFDDSDDEFEDEYLESNKIIGKIEKQLNQKRKDSDERDRNEEIRKAVEIETKRIYNDLQRALKRTEKRKAPPVEVEKPPQKRRQIIKTEVRLSCDNETGVQVNEIEEVVISEEFDALIQSDDGDDSNELNDNENERDYTDIVDYIPTEEDEQEEDDDEEDEYELPKTRPRRENKNETRPSETNYTVLESGDIALSTELVDVGEFPESEEYLEEEYDPNDNDDEFYIDSILPAIKKTIASKSGVHLDENTKYKVFKKPDNEIEVECTTSDGKVFSVEMVIDPLQTHSTSPQNFERDEAGDLKVFKCDKCDSSFSRRYKLISHMREHEQSNGYLKCPHCSKSFPSNSTLTRHIRVHTGEKPFKCDICNRAFIQKEILKRHAMTHSGERPFKCDHCPKSFILKEALKQHVNRNHSENPVMELHKCPLCPKSFCHSSGLSRHLLIHAGKTFTCEFCEKAFNDRSALKRHTATIHNVRMTKNEKEAIQKNEKASKVKTRSDKSK